VARRNRSSSNPPWIIAGLAILAAAFALGAYFISSNGEPYRTTAPLEVSAYLENSNSLRGNTYKVTGEIQNVLGYSSTEGRLISVGINDNSDFIPILIPASLSHINIQKGQKFIFQLEVTDKGILRAKDLTKA